MPEYDAEFFGIVESEELDKKAELEARMEVCADRGHSFVRITLCSRCFEAFGSEEAE